MIAFEVERHLLSGFRTVRFNIIYIPVIGKNTTFVILKVFVAVNGTEFLIGTRVVTTYINLK